VAQVVLFLRAHGAVGHHHADILAHQALDGVIGVDPGVDAGGGFELGPGRSQFDRDDVWRLSQRREQDAISKRSV
jgi:hypothetical protein